MNEIVPVACKDMMETKALAKDLAASQLLPQALRKKPEDILAIVLTGAELGLGPMTAVRSINIINGKVSLSANIMVGLVKRRADICEYFTLVESTDQVATYKTKRRGGAEVVFSYTYEQAKKAGLTSNPNYQKHPAAMLRARCESALCKAEYADLCNGLYDSDSGELSAEVTVESDNKQEDHASKVASQLKTAVAQPPKVQKEEITDAEFTELPKTEPLKPLSLEERINAADMNQLKAMGAEIASLSKEEKIALKPIYDARKAALTGAK